MHILFALQKNIKKNVNRAIFTLFFILKNNNRSIESNSFLVNNKG